MKVPFPLPVSRARKIAASEFRPFDAEALKAIFIDFATKELNAEWMEE
jgi:hypothetical protein